MIGTVLETEDLARLFGYKQGADLARHLREQGIAFKMGRHGPVTTTEALNYALGVPLATPPSVTGSKIDPTLF